MNKTIEKIRGNVRKNKVDEKKVIELKNIQTTMSLELENVDIYIEIKDCVKDGDIGLGFKATKEIEEIAGKIVKVNRVREKHRNAEIVKIYGGEECNVLGFGVTTLNGNNIEKLESIVDESWVKTAYEIHFKSSPIEERIEDIQKELEKTLPNIENKKEQLKSDYNSMQREVVRAREELTRKLRTVSTISLELSALENAKSIKDFRGDILSLTKHPLFKDLEIVDDNVIFSTQYIDIIDPNNSDNVFLGNIWELSVNMKNSRVKFKGLDRDRCHESAWSNNDPHPHVSRDGNACWGNISTTIAQLVDEKEIYALFVMLTNYLETFNIEDYAGKKIKNWKMKDGSKNPFDKSVKCSYCGEGIENEDDEYTCEDCGVVLCNDCYAYNHYKDKRLCNECYNESIYKCAECGETHENEEEEGEICAICGEWVCDDCKVNSIDDEDETLCPSCKLKENDTEKNSEEIQAVVNKTICQQCEQEVDKVEPWIYSDMSVKDICEECITKNTEEV